MPKFVKEPAGNGVEVLEEDDIPVLVQKPVGDTQACKIVLVDELQDTTDGQYFEIKVEECLSGFIPSLAVGFTGADVADPAFEYPRMAKEMEKTYVAGYAGKVCWSGEEHQVDWNPSQSIVARGHETIGVLMQPDGELVVFINNKEVVRCNPDDEEYEIPDVSSLKGVVDVYGGPTRIRLLQDKMPPTAEDNAEE